MTKNKPFDIVKIINKAIERAKNNETKNFLKAHRKNIDYHPKEVKDNHENIFYKELNLYDNKSSHINTPKGKVQIQKNHYVKQKNPKDKDRKNFIRCVIPTLKKPNEIREKNGKRFYLKIFATEKKLYLHVVIVKVKKDGIFYVTNIPMSRLTDWEKTRKKGNPIFELPQACK